VDFLRSPWVSKEVRNAFKSLDYDTLDIHRVEFLPPTFDGDVLFELPPVDGLMRPRRPAKKFIKNKKIKK
jgi:hypothetical protein